MITFKQYMTESIATLYRQLDGKASKIFQSGKSVAIRGEFASFVKDQKHLKSEFGQLSIKCNVADLPKDVKIIEIQYDLAWFTRNPLHAKLLKRVTGRTEKDLLDEFDGDIDAIEESLENYEDEHEVIVIGLKQIDPAIFEVLT